MLVNATLYVMNTERGSARAGELLEIMRFRLKLQSSGLTHARKTVVHATERLVAALAKIDSAEIIWVDVRPSPGILGRYVQASSGEVLAEITEHDV